MKQKIIIWRIWSKKCFVNIPDSHILVSVKSLFTSIPIKLALESVEDMIKNNPKLKETTSLNPKALWTFWTYVWKQTVSNGITKFINKSMELQWVLQFPLSLLKWPCNALKKESLKIHPLTFNFGSDMWMTWLLLFQRTKLIRLWPILTPLTATSNSPAS